MSEGQSLLGPAESLQNIGNTNPRLYPMRQEHDSVDPCTDAFVTNAIEASNTTRRREVQPHNAASAQRTSHSSLNSPLNMWSAVRCASNRTHIHLLMRDLLGRHRSVYLACNPSMCQAHERPILESKEEELRPSVKPRGIYI